MASTLCVLGMVVPLVAAGWAVSSGAPSRTKTKPKPKAAISKAATSKPKTVAPSAKTTEGFVLQDFLGRAWRNESVRFSLSTKDAQHVKAKHGLIAPDGKAVAYQLVSPAAGQSTTIEFLTDLAPWEKRAYKFASAAKTATTDLKVEESEGTLRLTNSLTGISIRRQWKAGQGPIESIRLKSGKWVGGSRLNAIPAPTSYSAKVLARGPVFSEVQCRYEFPDASSWQINFRLNAGEPVILVDEKMTNVAGAVFSLSLNDNFNPDKVLYRRGQQVAEGDVGGNVIADIKPGNIFVLEPRLRWSMQTAQGLAFSVYNEGESDLLSIGARESGVWVDPTLKAQQEPPQGSVTQDEQGLHLDFVQRSGRRKWMITALDKADDLKIATESVYAAPLSYQYLIKHGHFPLDLVKDYLLEWKGDHDNYPRLLVTRKQVAQYRAAVTAEDKAFYEGELPRYLREGFSPVNLHAPIAAYFATGNEALGKELVRGAVEMMQLTVEAFTMQERRKASNGTIYGQEPYGARPHNQQYIGVAPLLADAALGTGQATPQQRQRLLAQLAFLGYTVARPEYWSPERGYAGNPNMTTSVNGYRTVIASAIPSHPEAAAWANDSVAKLKQDLNIQFDDNGGALESPHYAMVQFDQILSGFVMTYNAGFNNYLHEDPKIKKVARWYSKISTPPDSRTQGRRHLPPIGHTYISEPTGEFGVLASLFKEKDPAFAAEMQWMFRQQGSWPEPGIGGSFPGFAGYRKVLVGSTIPEKAPQYESEMFPNTGVLLRSNFPSPRETRLHLLAGSFGGYRSHMDDDSGSFTLWGKGRIISDDWGYPYGGAGIALEIHNLLDMPEVRQTPIFNVQQFAPSEYFDYVSGTRGPWQRQIAFIKDSDPAAPNYFVISDSAKGATPGALRLWLTAAKVTPGANSALVEGKEDVDTDIFFASPAAVALKTEEATRTSSAGIDSEGKERAMATTQTALIASTPAEGATLYVLYPRLKTEKPPVFTSMADGKAVRIKSEAGTDYVFLSATPFTWKEGTLSYEGTSGSIRFRGKQMVLSLGESGSIGGRGESLVAKKAVSKEVKLAN